MKVKLIKSELGLIGKDLELKKNVEIILDDKGVIKEIYFEDFDDKFKLIPNKKQELIVPGFINAHVHVGDNFAKERGFNKDLIEVVAPPNGIKHRLLSLTPKDVIIEGMKKAGYEMLSNGITCFMDFREQYIKGINLANEALKNVKIRYLLLGRFENNGEIEGIFKIADGIGLSSYKVVNHENKNLLKILKKKYGKIIACHDAELVRKQEVFEKILEDDLVDVIIHGTHYNVEDLKKLKKKKIHLVMCPRSNGYFGVGFPPIVEAFKEGLVISLGTDNLMVNAPDLFEELRYLYRIMRVLGNKNKNNLIEARNLLKMITINAAKTFKLENEIGTIEKGKKADFFVINLNDVNFYSIELDNSNIHALIVNRTNPKNIKKTFVGGEMVYFNN